jgi:16S rRNA (cytosine967-C5)-methyltransferase
VTPAARLAAAAQVLDQIAGSRGPAEGVLQAWGRANRYAGSGDRRAIADRVFACLRARGRLSAAGGAEDGRTLVLFSLRLLDGRGLPEIEALFSGAGYAPAALTEAERVRLSVPESAAARLPEFVEADFQRRFRAEAGGEGEALLNARAALDLRVNGGDREAVAAELRNAGFAVELTPWSAWGLRLPGGSDVGATAAWREGRVEVQDEGSQLAAWLAGARPGERVIDYCAGGGGKTLALAQSLGLGRTLTPGPSPTRGEGSKMYHCHAVTIE